MTETILNFLFPQKVKDFFTKIRLALKGKKTYIAATIILLEASFVFLDQAISLETVADVAAWLQALPANPLTAKIAEALALFGIRAAIGKKN